MRGDALCCLVYVDVGTNRGDSIEAFVRRDPAWDVRDALLAAQSDWQPSTSCIYGFEPNPMFTQNLSALQARLSPQAALLDIATETAIVDSESISEVVLSVDHTRHSEGSTIVGAQDRKRPGTVSAKAVSLVTWLRAASRRHPRIPIVMRFDIEGAEYNVLKSLAVSGAALCIDPLPASARVLIAMYLQAGIASGRKAISNPLFVGVEWHRYLKARALSPVLQRYSSGPKILLWLSWSCGEPGFLISPVCIIHRATGI